ncbi:MAG: hypothetical protein KF833_19500 [Verrucomicrobiae bacterium]|nr:hypothetical protein [Verrucomicrobiae bacterium]
MRLVVLFLAVSALIASWTETYATSGTTAVGPRIIEQPMGGKAELGGDFILQVGATGIGTLQFQWFLDGQPLPSETSASLALVNLDEDQFGAYTVVVADSTGSVMSEPAFLTLAASAYPVWFEQPRDVTAALGSAARFTAVATGPAPIAYRWRLNGSDIPDANGPTLDLPSVSLADGGAYTLFVTTSMGTLRSQPAVLRLDLPALPATSRFADRPLITEASGAGTLHNAGAVSETAAGEPRHAGKRGGSSVWFSWQPPDSGQASVSTVGSSFDTLLGVYTGDTLGSLIEVVSDDDRGGYRTSAVRFNAEAGTVYHIAVDGFAGAQGQVVVSWDLLANAGLLPRILIAPEDDIAISGGDKALTVKAEGDALTYQWYFNGIPIPGASDATIPLGTVSEGRAGLYVVRVSTPAGDTIETVAARVEIASGPAAAAQDKLDDLFENPPASPLARHVLSAGGFTSVAPGIPGWRETTNEGAQRSPEDPIVYGELGGATLWFRFQATASGWMRLSTEGSSIPVVLGVYTNRHRLQPISEARPTPPGTHCELLFPAHAGTDYMVMIDGVNGAQGIFRLSYSIELAPIDSPLLTHTSEGLLYQRRLPPGRYAIEAGDSLARMTPLLVTNAVDGVLRFLDTRSGGRTRHFYRVTGLP